MLNPHGAALPVIRAFAGLALVALTPLLTAAPVAGTPGSVNNLVATNDNRTPAGRVRHGVLAIHLDARTARWRPEGVSGPALPIFAFAEEGHTPLVPGPLIRVPAGTEVRATLRNSLPKPLVVGGLQERPATALDSINLDNSTLTWRRR